MQSTTSHVSLTYAAPDDPWWRRLVIEGVEYATGRRVIERLYNEAIAEKVTPQELWGLALEKLGIRLEYDTTLLQKVPASGPVVFIANHPFGVVDGLALGHLVGRVRPKFTVLVNEVLCRNEQLKDFLLPVDFRETKEAMQTNINTRHEALLRLQRGEALAIFPSGGVATAPRLGQPVEDLEWKRFVVKLITQSQATVVPFFFHGENSFLFQLASHIHSSLRLGLLLYEVANKRNQPVRVTIGKPLAPADWQSIPRNELLAFLHQTTWDLGLQGVSSAK